MVRQVSVSRIETILVVEGPLAGDAVEELNRTLSELAKGSLLTITLDLSHTTGVNSAAIGKLLLFSRKLAEQRKTFQIQGCSTELFRVFKALQFDKLMKIETEPRNPEQGAV
jgi:anti-anti-sigma regulatory factor